MQEYKDTSEWFAVSEIKGSILNHLDGNQKYTILEIGTYEGLSSVFFADNLLDHPESSLTCVDPFLTIDNNDHADFLQNNQELNYDYNISICKNSNKITTHKITSDEFFKINSKTFNFIYIDGSHDINFIQRDMDNSWECLYPNSIMWMDDYGGGPADPNKKCCIPMDNFLENHKGQYELIHKGYQLAIKKI